MAESLSADEFAGFKPAEDEFAGFKPVDDFEGFSPAPEEEPISDLTIPFELGSAPQSLSPSEAVLAERSAGNPSGSISGSDPILPPEPIPDVAPENRARVDADVAAAQAVMGAQMLPYRLDAFNALSQSERAQQVADAEVAAGEAKSKLAGMLPDQFSETRADAEYDFQQKQKRATALDARYQAASPMGVEQTARTEEEQKLAAEHARIKAEIEAGPNAPNFIDTFVSRLTGNLGAQATAVLRTGGLPTQGLSDFSQQAQEGATVGRGAMQDVARGTADAGSMLLGNPSGGLGLVAAGLRAANQTREEVLRRTGSTSLADDAAVKTYPALAAYMIGGMAGGRLGSSMVAANAAPLVKGAAGFTGAIIGNITPSMAMRIAEGEEYGIEALSADALMALFHSHGEYKGAVKERAQKRAEAELLSRGFSEQQIKQGYEEGGFRMRVDTPAALVAPQEVQTKLRADDMLSQAELKASEMLKSPEKLPEQPPPVSGRSRISAVGITDKKGQLFNKGEIGTEHKQLYTNEAFDAAAKDDAFDGSFQHVFLNEKGELISREQAWEDAEANGQIKQEVLEDAERGDIPRALQSQHLKVEPERNLGPGAANVEEPLQGPRFETSNKEAVVNTERAARQLDPVIKEAKITHAETIDRAETVLEQNPRRGDEIVERLRTNPQERTISLEDAGVLLVEKTNLLLQRKGAEDAINDPLATPEELVEATARFNSIEKRIAAMDQAAQDARSTWGRFGGLWQRTMRQDFTLSAMEARARAVKGKLTPEDVAKIKTLSEEGTEAQKTLEQREQDAPVDATIKAIEAEASKDPTFSPQVKSITERIATFFGNAADAARKRMRERAQQLSINPFLDPTYYSDAVIIGADYVAKGLNKFSKWASAMVQEFGDNVKPHLEKIWKDKEVNIDRAIAARVNVKDRAKVKDRLTGKSATEQAEVLGGEMLKKSQAGEKLTDMRGDVDKLVRTLVAGGIKTREPLVDAVHEVMKKVDPAVTRRQASEAISKYGDFRPLSKDEVSKTVRDLKQQLQLEAKIEDVLASVPLKRSGPERQPLSDEGRAMTKKLNELSRELGIKITDPATQLKSILGALETRLTNRIKDLKGEIAKGERAVKTRTPTPTNEKIESLRRELAEVQAQHEALLGKREMTDEQKLRTYKTRTEKRIGELEKRIKDKDFGPRSKKQPLDLSKDPEAVKAKAKLEQVKKEFAQQQEQWKLDQRSRTRKLWDGVKEVLATSRSLITSADVSAPFRQGAFLLMGDMVFHPVRAAKQIGTMFRQLVSEKNFQEAQAAILLRPNAKLYEQSKLYLADMDGKLSSREESMRSTLAERIPIIKYIIRASNRAYSGFLNRQRADSFDALIESAGGRDKVTPEQAKALADFVNTATGRGTVAGMEQSANALARYFFSPRFLASRFQMALGQPLVNAASRKLVAQQYAKFALGLSAVYGLMQLSGGTVEKDPRSADFGKAKFGDTRIDPLAGLAQVTVFMSRMATGQAKTGERIKDKKRSDTFTRFARTKLAPIPSIGADFAAERTLDNQKPTAGYALQRLTVPISYQDAPAVYGEHGAVKATIMEALNLMGMGLQKYSK